MCNSQAEANGYILRQDYEDKPISWRHLSTFGQTSNLLAEFHLPASFDPHPILTK